jgi:hypothetical protein
LLVLCGHEKRLLVLREQRSWDVKWVACCRMMSSDSLLLQLRFEVVVMVIVKTMAMQLDSWVPVFWMDRLQPSSG